jgi:outer membrane immunogenic protein
LGRYGGDMRTVASAALFAACVGVCGQAWAADLSLKDAPEYEYTRSFTLPGFYIGGSLGAANTSVDIGDTYVYEADPFAANSFDTTGMISGVEIGYNVQSGKIVYGLSAGLGYMDISGSVSADLPRCKGCGEAADLHGTYETEGGLFGELTGRIGYASGRSLFYVKGGGAFLNTDFSSDYVGKNCTFTTSCAGKSNTDKPSLFGFENSETLVGWTAGVGVEYALTSNWSVKAEYQHFDFGTQSFDYSGKYNFAGSLNSELSGSTDVDYAVDAIKIGVNYRFGSGGE